MCYIEMIDDLTKPFPTRSDAKNARSFLNNIG